MSERLATVVRPLGSASPALLIALAPKCPACLGAYLAVASSVGLDRVSPGALQAITIAGLALAIALLGRAAARRQRWRAFALASSGAAIVTVGRLADAPRAPLLIGVILLYAGALWIAAGKPRRACHST